ncbi:pentatricopeptide repeat-containing protein At1g08070, chloroplastic [Neltuma alba]|uniref:pentatricopeptide repeat-containing protein At1g08070, chloroplastic n=1 Tax=Neltuma alba TaxID=207710 RepID=UPI0010A4B822|nr:pentatricopeptide repeat-containing protein At1g08070, chloroplastic-like [Prosopis alba]XP_028804986.1 pentatricopeptide repeat-containing protein At1g08070, chloroplastic-like [Prosopis alba]XP_028804987.1 pentatricopeptide repeat-containing protein At1g08070, chloroplastic-like [Prosopis alba]XP_028804988.1 pentatricopeptide repeat-containing protein At1g08070, chloroplastic-like [Prosopis alba]XP_028804989.1 pentatricopeptide repeat-containing protein At1g08070, chloroplastic-like [Proso
MLKLPHVSSLHPHLPPSLNLFEFCRIKQEAKQLHALSLKTGIFSYPSISSRLLALYADPKINNLDYARSVFDCMEAPSLVSWNLIIKCYIENQCSHDGILLFYEMIHELLPDNFTLPCLIKGCTRLNATEEGKQIHGLVLKIGFGSDKFVQSSLVSMYSKWSEMDLAQKIFDQMDNKDLVSWNCLIDGYARNGNVEVAMELFDKMPDRDIFTWTSLVDGLAKCGKLETAREIFDQMPSKNLVSWTAMINGYMKYGQSDLADQLFHQMPVRNLISWNSMIAGYEHNGQYFEALHFFVALLGEGLIPSDATMLSALSAVSGSAVLNNGRCIHSFMLKRGFELDGVLGTSLIDMYSKCGSIESALAVFKAIANKKLGHWTAIIMGLGMHGMAENALELFLEMLEVGMKPLALTFVGVLNACNHGGLVDEGRRFFYMMINEYKIEPTIEHYGCFVDTLCRAGYLQEAKNIIESMPMRPNKVIWMSLLGGSRNHGNLELGEYAAHNLIEVDPNAAAGYIVLSNMYAASGKWDKVSHVREMMMKRGVRKDAGCSFVEQGGKLHRFIAGDKAHPQTENIYAKLGEMREKLKLAGHIPDTSQVLLHVENENEKEFELEIHSERLAIAFGLLNMGKGSPVRIIKNLRVCNDCHAVTKLLSNIYNREFIVRDSSRFHHFKNGSCSCGDFW